MIRINLIRDAEAQLAATSSSPTVFIAFITSTALIAATHLLLAWQIAGLSEASDSLQFQLARARTMSARVHTTPARPAGDQRSSGAEAAARRLRALVTAMPRELWLTQYREREQEVVLRGVAMHADAPRVFVEKLTATTLFDGVEITEAAAADVDGANRVFEFGLRAAIGIESGADDASNP